MNDTLNSMGGLKTPFIFLFLLVVTIGFVSASEFGIGGTNKFVMKNFYINNTYINITNGSGFFVEITGSTMTGDLNVSKNVNITGNLFVMGNISIKRPYGMFSSTQTQTMGSANTAYVITFNWTEDDYEVYKSGEKTNFSVGQSGDYLIEISAIFSTDTNNKKVELWIQKNGINIPRSNTIMTLPTSSTEIPLAVPFIIDLNMSDSFRVMMATNDAGSQLLYVTNTSYSPETPSIIMTMSKISEITP